MAVLGRVSKSCTGVKVLASCSALQWREEECLWFQVAFTSSIISYDQHQVLNTCITTTTTHGWRPWTSSRTSWWSARLVSVRDLPEGGANTPVYSLCEVLETLYTVFISQVGFFFTFPGEVNGSITVWCQMSGFYRCSVVTLLAYEDVEEVSLQWKCSKDPSDQPGKTSKHVDL